jgi:hypothetical protein
VLNSIPLKLISIILGYTFWYIFGHSHTITTWITVPLTFYNVPQYNTVKAPEYVSLKISGKRADISALDITELAIHINAQKLQEGPNLLPITSESLFLPPSIKLVHYSPSNPMVELHKKL